MTKVELFGRSVFHHICCKSNTAFHEKNIVGGGSVMVWDILLLQDLDVLCL